MNRGKVEEPRAGTLVLMDTFAQRIRRRDSFCFEQSLAPISKGVPNGRHKCTERDHAHNNARACRLELARVEHAQCERFYRPGKDDGRRAAKALRRSVRL